MLRQILSIRFHYKSLLAGFICLLYGINAMAVRSADSLFRVWSNRSLTDSIRLIALSDILFDREWMDAHEMQLKPLIDSMRHLANKTGIPVYILRHQLVATKYAEATDSLTTSLSLYNQCLSRAQELGDYFSIGKTYSGLAIASYKVGDMQAFFANQKQSLEAFRQVDNDREMAWQLHNLGYAFQELKQLDSAILYYKQSMALAEQINFNQAKANCLAYLGESYQLKGEIPTSLEYFNASLALKRQHKITTEITWTQVKMGEGLIALGRYAEAARTCQLAYDTAVVKKEHDAIRYACHCLYQSNKALGNITLALRYLEEWNRINEEMDKLEVTKNIQKGDFTRQLLIDSFAKAKEKQLVQEAQQQKLNQAARIRNIILLIGLFVMVVAIALFSRLRYTRKAKAEVESEKDRSDQLLLNILPGEVAEELKNKGSADAKHFDQVTVMFTDFKGFTLISEKLTPSELVAEIHTCFKAFDDIISTYNIEKIKTIGDAYMCAGGLPVSNTTNAFDVLQAALDIQQFMQQHALERKAAGKELFEIRIGIHSGPVVAGIVGVKKFAYDIWGDTVNIASRMESSGEAGRINISGSTYELVKDKFTCTYRGKIQAKNKGEIDMYFLEAKRP